MEENLFENWESFDYQKLLDTAREHTSILSDDEVKELTQSFVEKCLGKPTLCLAMLTILPSCLEAGNPKLKEYKMWLHLAKTIEQTLIPIIERMEDVIQMEEAINDIDNSSKSDNTES